MNPSSPFLSENCYGCHGPDSSSRKAELRLDTGRVRLRTTRRNSAPPSFRANRTKPADPAHRSERPAGADAPAGGAQDPKAGANRVAPSVGRGRRTLRAALGVHRAETPRRSSQRGCDQWARKDIDRFIFERLQKDKLSPAAEAHKRSLIRRVTYDLTGLPPTVEEVEAFLADKAPDAYEKVVDRLLASPRYGEHRAHYWLDSLATATRTASTSTTFGHLALSRLRHCGLQPQQAF